MKSSKFMTPRLNTFWLLDLAGLFVSLKSSESLRIDELKSSTLPLLSLSESSSCGIVTHCLRKWVVVTIVSAKILRSFWSFYSLVKSSLRLLFVLMFGSFGQLLLLCPISLQHVHFEYFFASFISNSELSSSTCCTCLPTLQPLAWGPFLPQHHHISPLNADKWVLQLHWKLSFSLYSS